VRGIGGRGADALADDTVSELGAGGDPELPEHLAQVVVHGGGADEQLGRDLPACGEKIQRIRTSGSLAHGEKSADTCSVAVCVTTPSPSYPTPARLATRRPPSAPSRYWQRTA
jgi:hypothetical protein